MDYIYNIGIILGSYWVHLFVGLSRRDDRLFCQTDRFGYRTTICGTVCDYAWLVLPLAGYVVMIWGCYIAYAAWLCLADIGDCRALKLGEDFTLHGQSWTHFASIGFCLLSVLFEVISDGIPFPPGGDYWKARYAVVNHTNTNQN